METCLVTILYNPNSRTLENVVDIFSSTAAHCYLIIDHSSASNEQFFKQRTTNTEYIWRGGANEGYGGGLSLAANHTDCDVIVYVSSARSTVNDPTWIDDIVAPLQSEQCGISGSVKPCQYDRIARFEADIFEPQIHVQGGVFAIRTEVLKRHSMLRFPQVFSDVYLSWSVIKSGYSLANVPSIQSVEGGTAAHGKISVGYPARDELVRAFKERVERPSAINEHLEVLQAYSARSNRVVEFGVESGNSTLALLAGFPKWMRSYDVNPCDLSALPHIEDTDWEFEVQNDLTVELPIIDLLFIDTLHTHEQMTQELTLHQSKVTRWIILHDTESFPKMANAVWEFIESPGCQFKLLERRINNNGLTILERNYGYPTV